MAQPGWGASGVVGDAIVDKPNHGGPDQAVYAYAREDLEVWAAGVGAWLEASSASCFTDFQARRANIRYRKSPDAKPHLLHTLNASGVALPRTLMKLS